MKTRLFAVIALLFTLCACQNGPHPKWTYDSVVYELNVRQYTPEGTFAAAQEELPRLKELGVDVVWLMPIYQIGEKERKGSLGSYYAIKDYKTVNPEFGTIEDFDAFVDAAHDCGLRVILDWVANHTSPDAAWVTEQPADWYYRDSLGNTMVEYDWTDIAKLNYENADVRVAMEDAMRFWLDRGIDGFRCDVAYQIPQDFWSSVLPKFRREYRRPLYFLAEGEEVWLHEAGFDATYGWKLHHLLNDIAQGKAGVEELAAYVKEDAEAYPAEAFRLMFTSNHDENSWSGTEFERMGDAANAMMVLCFTLPQGQPLIYSGQELGNDHRLQFFEKDCLTPSDPEAFTAFFKQLCALRHDRPALASGEKGGAFELVSTEDSTIVFNRVLPEDTVKVSVQLKAPWNWSVE